MVGQRVSSSEIDSRRRDLLVSLAVLALVVAIALSGLALNGNWPKFLRVGAAFGAYCLVLLSFLRARGPAHPDGRFAPLRWFVAAGAAAGIVSGIVRPRFDPGVLAAGTVAAAFLLGSVHYLALRAWPARAPHDH